MYMTVGAVVVRKSVVAKRMTGQNLVEWRHIQNEQNRPQHRAMRYTILNKRRCRREATNDNNVVCLSSRTETTKASHYQNQSLTPADEAEY